MTGLSLLLTPGTSSRQMDIDNYLEQAYNASVVLTSSAIAQLDDMKGTCLFYEAYKQTNDLALASSALCRSAGEVEEISAALFLEQAAVAELKIRPRPARRKAAFHLCMAGQRYEKIGMVCLDHLFAGMQAY